MHNSVIAANERYDFEGHEETVVMQHDRGGKRARLDSLQHDMPPSVLPNRQKQLYSLLVPSPGSHHQLHKRDGGLQRLLDVTSRVERCPDAFVKQIVRGEDAHTWPAVIRSDARCNPKRFAHDRRQNIFWKFVAKHGGGGVRVSDDFGEAIVYCLQKHALRWRRGDPTGPLKNSLPPTAGPS